MAEKKNGALKNFIATVKTEGLMRSSRYSVTLSPPRSVGAFNNLKKVLLFCSDVQMPGVQLNTTQIRQYGELRESPYEKQFDNVNMTFYVDNNMVVKNFFDTWMDSIQDPYTRTFEYYDYYTTNMSLDIEDLKDRKRYEVKLFECYPKSVGSVSVGYDNKEVMKLQVSMNYKYWTSRAFDAPKETKESPWARFLKMPSINGRELDSLGSLPQDYADKFTAFQESFNLADNDTMFSGATKIF